METIGCVFTLLVLIGAGSGLRWSGKLAADAGPVQVCSGQDIRLLWNFTLEKQERLKGMVWSCEADGQEEGVLATFEDNHFVPVPYFSGRLSHLQGGGIEVSCATILESGNYSIAVSTELADNSLQLYRKTASVTVVDTPKTYNGEIHVISKLNSVHDHNTDDWHVQLSCGNFSDLGQPPVHVIWTTPEGQQMTSSRYEDGFFHLLLPNPPVGGNYTCSIPASQTAMTCLDHGSPLLDTAGLEVEETAARLSLLEARQQSFVEQLAVERNVLEDQLAVQKDAWLTRLGYLANRTDALEQQDEADRQALTPVCFHATLTEMVVLEFGDILKMDNIVINQGGGYDLLTGYFTAPVNASYSFIATAGVYGSSNSINVYIKKEGLNVAKMNVGQYSSYQAMGTCHAIVNLKVGEKVWLETTDDSRFENGVTFFSGFRI